MTTKGVDSEAGFESFKSSHSPERKSGLKYKTVKPEKENQHLSNFSRVPQETFYPSVINDPRGLFLSWEKV